MSAKSDAITLHTATAAATPSSVRVTSCTSGSVHVSWAPLDDSSSVQVLGAYAIYWHASHFIFSEVDISPLTQAVSGLQGQLLETGSSNKWLLVAFNRALLEQVINMYNCYNICRCIPMDLFQISVEYPTSNVQLAWRTYLLPVSAREIVVTWSVTWSEGDFRRHLRASAQRPTCSSSSNNNSWSAGRPAQKCRIISYRKRSRL